jgi:hypothetical protein
MWKEILLIFKGIATGFCSHGFQDFGQRTKAGKGGLEQIEADKCGEEQPVRAEDLRKDETDQDKTFQQKPVPCAQ